MKISHALCLASTMFIFGACGAGTEEGTESTSKGGVDLSAFADDTGKSDLAKSTKVLDDMQPNAVVKGQFSRKVRTYGYLVNARKGAELTVDLKTVTGSDADAAGTSLDTMFVVHGPYKDSKNPGEKLIEADDTDDQNLNPPASTFTVEEDGKYFIAFTSFEDTGEKSEYELNLTCKGTDYECGIVTAGSKCKAGQLFIQGNSITDSQTWDKCDVVVLENLTVQEGATLTVKPGVKVQGNFIQGSGDNYFGEVGITVLGTLVANGTEDAPIAFTNFKEGNGWAGLTLSSKSNSIKHAFIENVHTAVEVTADASATLDHVVMVGDARQDMAAATTTQERLNLANSTQAQGGLIAMDNAEVKLTHSLVKRFVRGVSVFRSTLVHIEDSVIRHNRVGVYVEGEGGQNRTSCNTRAPQPPQRFFDPKIDHSDIIENSQEGFLLRQDGVFIQVQKSNIVGNRRSGISLQGGGLTEDSFIRDNNIYGNSHSYTAEGEINYEQASVQLQTFHASGAIDLSANYWKFISDPELSSTRQTCNNTNAPVIYTGFSPVPIEGAGPRDITEAVKQDSFEQIKQQ